MTLPIDVALDPVSLSPFELETPEEQADRQARARLAAQRPTDPTMAVWRGSAAGPGLDDMGMHQGKLDAMDTALREHAPASACPPGPAEDWHVDVCVRWCRYASRLGLLPQSEEDFRWAWAGPFLAPVVGESGWPRVAAELRRQVPQCPLNDTLTVHDVCDMHRSCGWPTGLTWVPGRVIDSATDGAPDTPDWLRACALMHVIKYTRLHHGTCDVHVMHLGSAASVHTGRQTVRASTLSGAPATTIATALGCSGGGTKKNPKPWHAAVAAALARLVREDLFALGPPVQAQTDDRRLVILPGAGLVPTDPLASRWIRHGMAVHGVHRAANGVVQPAATTDKLATTVAWGPADPAAVQRAEAALPRSYVSELPSTAVRRAFPNCGEVGQHASDYWAVMDAVILCGVVAPHEAEHEKPLVLAMPAQVDPNAMTNTGKTTLALALAKAFAPGITGSLRTGTSDQDQRAIGAALCDHGTACLDEFVLGPKGILGENNLFSLCSGQGILAGKLYSTNGTTIRLTAPLTVTTKVLDARPDLYNRSVVFPLTPFAGGTNGATRQALETGRWSFELRCSTLDMWDSLGLADVAAAAVLAGAPANGWRWPVHRYIAAALLDQATGQVLTEDQILARVDAAAVAQQNWMDTHAGKAADQGIDLTKPLPRLSVQQIFGNVPEDLARQAFPDGELRSSRQVLDTLRAAFDDDMNRLCQALGVPGRQTMRALGRALGSAMRAIPDTGLVLDTGAVVTRGKQRDGYMTVAIDYSDELVIVDDIDIASNAHDIPGK